MNGRIRFGEPIELTLPPERLPSASLLVQRIVAERREPFQAYITQEAYDKAWRQTVESGHTECGGTLIGHPFQTPDGQVIFIVIVDVIPQDSHDHSVGHFTVSPTEIARARAIMEQDGYFSVGWYHSHPGHGVFLSGQDMTIVRSIYNLLWHVAWVIDPLRQKEAFFHGSKGEKLTQWFLLTEEPEFVKASALYTQADEARKAGDDSFDRAKRYFEHLKRTLDDKPSLAYWRETGRYQDVLNALSELSANTVQTSSGQVPDIPSDSNVSADTNVVSNDELMKIPQRYFEAKGFLREALRKDPPESREMSKALQILEWIREESPGYKKVDQLVYCCEDIMRVLGSSVSPRRRAWSWSNEKRLTDRIRELKILLQSDQEIGG